MSKSVVCRPVSEHPGIDRAVASPDGRCPPRQPTEPSPYPRSRSAFGLIFSLTAHLVDWPSARGGSGAITKALVSYLQSLGGEVECSTPIASQQDLPPSRVVLFDTSPRALAGIMRDELPQGYRRRLRNFNYGPGVFKVDWALSQPIPWKDPRVATAPTVHVGGRMEEIAISERDAWKGRHTERPFLIACQQSHADPTRAPEGKHTGYAYCHVPHGSDMDMTERIEAQIERFASGFRDCILARHTTSCTDLERHNPNYVGGAIAGGAATLRQIIARPVLRRNPYATPNPRVFLCSASDPTRRRCPRHVRVPRCPSGPGPVRLAQPAAKHHPPPSDRLSNPPAIRAGQRALLGLNTGGLA